MSVLTTKIVKQTPTSSLGLNPSTPSTWTYGSWVEAIASAAAGTVISGIWFRSDSGRTEVEIEVGIGTAGNEVSIGRFRFSMPSNQVGHRPLFLPVPLSGINTGDRVSVRVRDNGISGGTNSRVILYYFEDFDGPDLTELTNTSAGADGTSLTPNGSAWTNSAWVELTSGIAEAISLYGIALTQPIEDDGLSYEVDLAIGDSGSETVIATMPGSHTALPGPFKHFWLPKIYPIAANTRVAARLRKSSTDTTAWRAALLYYNDVPVPITVDAGSDQTITIPTVSAQLAGSATHTESLPLTYTWSQDSGPAPVTFEDTSDPLSEVTFIPAIGTYVLRLTVTDGTVTVFDTVTITLQEALDAEDCPSGPWSITINGVDKTDRLKLEEVSIEYTLGSPGVLECLIIDTGDPTTAYRPAVGDVIIVSKGVRVFTGKIVTTEEDPLVDTNTGTGTRISANDYQRALSRRFFTKNYDPYSYATEPPEDGECAITTERAVVSVVDGGGGTATVITAYPHLLSTGDRVTFVGVSGTTPNINDEQFEVTVTADTVFTIPATLTTSGTGGKVVKLVQTDEIFDDLLPFLAAYGITVNVETPGPWIIAPNFSRATLEDVVNHVSRHANWVYRITPYKVLQSFSPGAIEASFELNSTNATVLGNVTNRRTREDYANALYVTGGRPGTPGHSWNRRSTWIADGVTQEFQIEDPDSWTIGSNCTHPGILYIDGTPNPITGLYPDDPDEWTWDVSTKTLHHTGTAIASGVVLEFVYHGPEEFVVYVTDDVAIAANNGEIEEDEIDAGEDATPATARALGVVTLSKRTVTQREAVVRTDVCLVLPGTTISVDIPSRLMSGDWMVTAVSAEDSEARDIDGSAKAYYTYVLLDAGLATTFIDYWKRLIG